ncbi:MAG: hypothetical protein M1371_06060 [Actinobacteria bacterium]|nr:hypothetical protein [Actinomycetota bacterium]
MKIIVDKDIYTYQQEYESIKSSYALVNIVGIDNILPSKRFPTADEWGSRILIIKTEEKPEEIKLSKRLTDTDYGSLDLNTYLQKATANITSIEEVRKITDKLPSLTKILLEDRHDE